MRNDRSGEDWQTIDDEVLSLFKWSVEYTRLAVAHTAWSRGEMSATVNEATRTISFSVKQPDPTVFFSQLTFMELPGEDFWAALPHENLESYFRLWRKEFVHESPPTLPDLEITADHPLVLSVIDTAKRFVVPELADTEDIDRFTVGEFRRLYSVLFVHCYLLVQLEDFCDTKYGRENCLGSSVFQLPGDEMIEYLATLAGLDCKQAGAILKLLTFDPKYSGTIVAQPFVKTRCGTVSLLARLFCHLEPSEILPRALIRRRTNIYEALINKIEPKNVLTISESLAAHMLQVRTRARLFGDGKRIEPDLLVYDSRAKLLLVADYKHSLTPVGVAETVNRTIDHAKHVTQVRKYHRFIVRFPNEVKRVFGCELSLDRIALMILYRTPMPIQATEHSDVLVVDWTSFKKMIMKEPIIHLGKTLEKYGKMSSMLHESVQWNLHYMEVQVGDWLYRREVYLGSDALTEEVST